MSREKTKDELILHKTESLSILSSYLDTLIESENPKLQGKADKLSYWLADWTTFLDFETEFSATSLRRYKHGEIVKVHLGFNVGSEEGGLHYAVVADKNNPKSSPVVTIIPLTSVKPTTNIHNLKGGSIFLGNELYSNLSNKISTTKKQITSELYTLQNILDKMDSSTPLPAIEELQSRIFKCNEQVMFLQNMRAEIQRMKHGSIALVNQITTISKIRIYDPKTDNDILSGIKLSNEKLDQIDMEIIKKFTNTKAL